MCKFCEKTSVSKSVYKVSKRGIGYETCVQVPGDPSLKDAEWKSQFMGDWEDGSPFDSIELSVENKELSMYYAAYSCDSSFSAKVKINYCPFCGRKL